MLHLEIWQWAVACLGAFLIGISKTGIAGIGIFAVSLFALIFPPFESSGIVLPILICADLVAAPAYRKHVIWSHVLRLFPWAAAGIIVAFGIMWEMKKHGNMSQVNAQIGQMMGAIYIGIVFVQLWRRRQAAQGNEEDSVPHTLWFAAIIGLVAGFTTMLSNAAGPIMILYLLSMRLPKMEFMGTGAWYFLILNSFKVPFSSALGLINTATIPLGLVMAPFAVSGALFGRTLLKNIDQRLFENLALAFTVVAGLKLLFKV